MKLGKNAQHCDMVVDFRLLKHNKLMSVGSSV